MQESRKKFVSVLKPRLYHYLEKNNITKYKLAKDSQVPQTVFSEKYTSGLSEETILKILKALPNLNVEEWMRGRTGKRVYSYERDEIKSIVAEDEFIYAQQTQIIKTQQDLIEALKFKIKTLESRELNK